MVLKKEDFLLHQYDALRAEIVQRTSIRFVINGLLITTFGAVFALSDKPIGVYLQILYPILSFFLLVSYVANSYGIHRISKFIEDHIEDNVYEADIYPPIAEIGWHHRKKYISSYLINNILFPCSSLITWGVSLITISDPHFTPLIRYDLNITWIALWLSLAIIVLSFLYGINAEVSLRSLLKSIVKPILGTMLRKLSRTTE